MINVVELKVEINIDNIIDDTLYWKCFRGFVSTLGTSIVLRKNSFVRAILQPHFAALFFTMLSWESLHNLYDQFGQLTHHHKSVCSCPPWAVFFFLQKTYVKMGAKNVPSTRCCLGCRIEHRFSKVQAFAFRVFNLRLIKSRYCTCDIN